MDEAMFRERYDGLVGLLRATRLQEVDAGLQLLRAEVEPGSVQHARLDILASSVARARVGRTVHGDASFLSSLIEADLYSAFETLESHADDAEAQVLAARVAIELAQLTGGIGEMRDAAAWYRRAAEAGSAAGDRFSGTADLFGASASFSIVSGAFDEALDTLAASSAAVEVPAEPHVLTPAPGEPDALAPAVERAIAAARGRGSIRLAFDLAKSFLVARANSGADARAADAVAAILRDLTESGGDDAYAVATCRTVLRGRLASPMMLAALGHSVGLAADRLGDHAVAGEIFRESLQRVAPYAELAEHPLVLGLRYEVAENARVMGESDEARDAFASLAVIHDRLDRRDAQAARVFNNYADALAAAGGYDEALHWAGKGLEVRERLFDGPHYDIGRSHVTLANALYALGRRDDAALHAREAARQYRHHPGTASTAYATALHLQAMCASPGEGVVLMREAVGILEQLPERQAASGLARARRDLALMELATADRVSALVHAERSVRAEIERVYASAHLDTARLKAVAASARQAQDVYLQVLSAGEVGPDEVPRAFSLQMHVSGLVSGIVARRRAWLEKNRPDLHAQVHQRVAQRVSLRPSDLLATPDELAAARLLRPDPENGAERTAQRLAPREALVQFAVVPALSGLEPTDRLVAFVIRPAASPAFVRLGPAAEIARLVDALQTILAQHGDWRDLGLPEGAPTGDASTGEDVARSLRRELWDPIEALLGDADTVYLVPDGALYRLPFGVLTREDGSHLAEHRSFVFLITAAHWEDFARKEPGPIGEALVLANPAFDLMPRGQGPPTPSGPFRPLAGAQREGEQVARILDVRAQDGAAARIGELACARSPEILHLATHGFAEIVLPGAGPRPLTGIALAGANDVLAGRDVPGDAGRCILDEDEVSALDLARTDLVVLSACSTAGGTVEGGEGVSGLVRAFLVAGARSVLATLWRVDDRRTTEWMEVFYRELLAGARRVDALAAANESLRRRHPDRPGYWAPFVLFGDAGPLVRLRDLPAERLPAVEIHGHSVVRRIDVGDDQVSIASIGVDPSDAANDEARAAQADRDHDRALDLVRKILDEPRMALGHARARNTQGFSYLNRGETAQALMAFTAGLYLGPTPDLRANLLYGRGTARLMDRDALGALADFDRVLPLWEHDDERASHVLINRGEAHARLGAWERARADAEAVLARPDAPDDQVGKARALLETLDTARGMARGGPV